MSAILDFQALKMLIDEMIAKRNVKKQIEIFFQNVL